MEKKTHEVYSSQSERFRPTLVHSIGARTDATSGTKFQNKPVHLSIYQAKPAALTPLQLETRFGGQNYLDLV